MRLPLPHFLPLLSLRVLFISFAAALATAYQQMDYVLCAGASVAFIASFYVWPRERRFLCAGVRSLHTATQDRTLYVDRDSDSTIRRRSLSFLQNCVVSGAFLAVQSAASSSCGGSGFLHRRRLFPIGRAAACTLLLFAGPVGDRLILRDFSVEASWLRRWRSYVLCPIGEELFFRGVLLSLLHRRSSGTQIAVAALLFALSHSHHIVSWACDEYIDRACGTAQCDADHVDAADAELQRTCWRAALRKLLFVYSYTGVFGALSGYYYLNVCEGCIGATAAVHAVCNFIGPPEFAVLRSPYTTPAARVVSAIAYVGGVVGWAWMLLH
jgi:prenyl protein peptidase